MHRWGSQQQLGAGGGAGLSLRDRISFENLEAFSSHGRLADLANGTLPPPPRPSGEVPMHTEQPGDAQDYQEWRVRETPRRRLRPPSRARRARG
jgi:hypothetical protein